MEGYCDPVPANAQGMSKAQLMHSFEYNLVPFSFKKSSSGLQRFFVDPLYPLNSFLSFYLPPPIYEIYRQLYVGNYIKWMAT
jgi:hypothetical protein